MDKSFALSILIGGAIAASLRNAVGGTVSQFDRLGQSLRQAENNSQAAGKAVTDIERKVANVGAYRALGRDVMAAGRAHREAEAHVRKLATELAATEQPTKKAQAAYAAAQREVRQAAAAVDAKKQKLATLRAELKAAGVDTANLSAAERKLAVDLSAAKTQATQAAKAVDQLEKSIKAAEKRSEAAATIRNRLAGIGAVGLAMKPAADAGGDFEHALVRFGQVADMNRDQLAELRLQLVGLSRDVNQSATDLLAATGILVGKGMKPDMALKVIGPIGKAATATGAAIEDMANLTFSVLDNLKVAPEEITKALDIMAQAGKEGGFELRDMAKYFPQLTATAAALGLKGTEGVSTLAAALQVAMKGASDAGTAANNFANFLAKATAPETVKNFEKMGVDIKTALTEGIARGENPMEAVIKQVGEAMGVDLGAEIADQLKNNSSMDAAVAAIEQKFKLGELFTDAQVTNFIVPMIANLKEYDRVKKSALGASGVVDNDFATIMKTFNEATKGLSTSFGNLMEAFGGSVLPVLTPLVSMLGGILDGVTWLINTFPTMTGMAVAAGAGFMLLRTAMAAGSWAMTFFSGGTGGLIARLLGLTVAQNAATAAGSRFGLMAVLTGARLAGSAIISGIVGMGSALMGFASAAIPAVITGLRALTVALMTNPIGLIVGGLAIAAGLIISNWTAVRDILAGLWEPVRPIWEAFAGWVGRLWETISAPFRAIGEWFGGKAAPAAVAGVAAVTAPTGLPSQPASVPASSAAQIGAMTATINVYAAPGMNEQQVAALVRRELEDFVRRNQAAKRGAMHDG